VQLYLYSPHTSSCHDKEQHYVYFYDGRGRVTVVGHTVNHGTSFGNLIIESMSGHIKEVTVLGEELK